MMWVENSRASLFKKFTFGDDFSENFVEKKDVENEVDKEIARNISAESLEELIYSQEHLNHAVAEAVALSNTKIVEDTTKKEKQEIQYSLKKIREKICNLDKLFLREVKTYSESLSKSLFDLFFSTFPVIENIAAEDVVAGICNKILPLLENNFKITVIINPLIFDAITKHDDVSKIFQAPWITVEQSEKLGPSDIEIIWPDGHLIRDVESATKDILMYVAGDFTK